MNNQTLRNQKLTITRQINVLKQKLKTLPKDELLCCKCGNYTNWYKSNGAAPIYIKKKNRQLAEKLALKKYCSLQLEELTRQLHFLNQYLENCEKIPDASQRLLEEASPYKELLLPYFQTMSKELSQWAAADYEHNSNYPESLIHKTLAGHMVRSKSEVMIANALFRGKVPYRYEAALHLDDGTFYPDFTILHPHSQEIFYWEHFGLMDKQSYRDSAFNKLKIFADHGIIPSVNFITTFETAAHPVDSENIQKIIQDTFL
ncbi:MAG: hypothetical protein PHQ72_10445 [Hespellia sp.]|nr:hypothetical protein [Hespellia sp.]